ncbi:MAG: glycosyltransferase [Treponema sp.]|nr:glycosyltransferase [Treponema sp.]
MITILANYERISLFHTMIPFFLFNKDIKRNHGKSVFRITQSAAWCLKNDKNKILFMERCFQHREPRDLEDIELDLLKKLRDKYKTIVFFCGQPEAGTNRLDILPFVDHLFYKSVFSNRSEYKKILYGKNLFSDYYHKNFGVNDNPEYINRMQITDEQAAKLKLSWNIGIGTYPRRNWPQRLGAVLARAGMPLLGQYTGGKSLKRALLPGTGKKIKNSVFSGNRSISVHARIDPVTCPSIAFQRVHFLNLIQTLNVKNKNLFLTGTVKQEQYYRELMDSKIVLSPFGWGEVCFRDFEAILSGALLLKPDMSHLVTWPNVYIPYETYIPLEWNGSDLMEKTKHYLDDEKERQRIVANAFEQYKNETALIKSRAESLLSSFIY